MKKIFLFTALLVFISSCDKEIQKTKKLVISDVITLPVEKYVLQSTACLEYIQIDKNKFLYYITNNMSTLSNEILVFDLNKRKLHKKIIFNSKNGFERSIHGFSIINKDSMIVSNILSDTLYTTNLSGEVLKKYPYQYLNKKNDQTIFKLFSRNEKPIIAYRNKLFFSPSIYAQKKNDLKTISIAFLYNCNNKKIENLNLNYPKEFQSSKFFTSDLSYCANGEKIIYSSKSSNSIWVYDLNNKKFKTFSAESDYFIRFCKNSDVEIDMKTAMYNIVYNSSYTEIVYDKYRKVYYRFFYPGIDIEKDSDELALKAGHFGKMSIIILDENFNKIGESFFENKFRFYSNFITEEGLYVCSNLPEEKNKNKKLKYTLLKLVNE